MSESITERVTESLQQLRLRTAADTLDTHVRAAPERDSSPLQFVDHLLADELAARQERSITVRTKLAHLPELKSLDSFNFDVQPSIDRKLINNLRTLALVDRAENVVLLGPPGVGKTHLSIGLGMRALQAGHCNYFLTAQDLLDQIRIAQLDGVPGHKQRHLNTVPLLIIDELGYVEFDKSAATWLFHLICQRYEHRSTIVTSNKPFSDWGQICRYDASGRATRSTSALQPRPEPQRRQLPPSLQVARDHPREAKTWRSGGSISTWPKTGSTLSRRLHSTARNYMTCPINPSHVQVRGGLTAAAKSY